MNYTPEFIQEVRAAKTPEELIEIAKENGKEMSAGTAEALYQKLHAQSGELADDELGSVAGGGCGQSPINDIGPKFAILDKVRVLDGCHVNLCKHTAPYEIYYIENYEAESLKLGRHYRYRYWCRCTECSDVFDIEENGLVKA